MKRVHSINVKWQGLFSKIEGRLISGTGSALKERNVQNLGQ
jgi:hypothetical protein